MPPLAVSSTATSTVVSSSTISAERGPDASASSTHRPPMKTPSVHDIPVRRPAWRSTCAIILTVVVLPLVPVTDTIGILASGPGG